MKQSIVLLIFWACFGLLAAEEALNEVLLDRVLDIDSKGNIFINRGNNKIIKYSSTGQLLKEIGQEGEGPSDIKRLGWFAINPLDDTLYVTEYIQGNKWVSQFSNDGKYLGMWKNQLDKQKYDGLLRIKIDTNSNFYIEVAKFNWRKVRDFSIETEERELLKFSTDGRIVRSIFKLKEDIAAEKNGKSNITLPFQNYYSWYLFGDKIYIFEGYSTTIKVLDTNGKLLKEIPLPFKREKLESKDLDKWEQDMTNSEWGREVKAMGLLDMKYWRERIPVPEYKSIHCGSMFMDSQGYLYVQRFVSYDPLNIILVKINVNTNQMTLFQIQPNEYIRAIWKNYFFIVKSTEDDEATLVKIDEKEVSKRWHPYATR